MKSIGRDENVLVWFGHSSYFIQADGKRILVDPVFCAAAPLSFLNKPFKGTDIYKPEDMPDIDYLVITHDHWDHLDYGTVMQLKERTGKVVCPLGWASILNIGASTSRVWWNWTGLKMPGSMRAFLFTACLPVISPDVS